nr:hypothetical protein [Tanacetum cinerariifolium]
MFLRDLAAAANRALSCSNRSRSVLLVFCTTSTSLLPVSSCWVASLPSESHVFHKRRPGRELDEVAKAAAVRHFIEGSRIEGQEAEEHEQRQQDVERAAQVPAQQQRSPQDDFERAKGDAQKAALCEEKRRSNLSLPYAFVKRANTKERLLGRSSSH